MSQDTPTDTTPQDEQRVQTQLGLGALVVPLFFAAMFAACIIGTYHKPHPSGIKVAVVGPAPATAPLRTQLEKAAASTFDIRQVTTIAGALHAVRQRHLDAAFVPTVNPKRPATVIVASAGGRLVATAAETLARSITAAQGAQLNVREARPLTSGDEIGLGVFLFLIVCTIAGYITPTILETIAPALAPSRRYPMILGAAVLIPVLVYLIAGLGFGTYTGSLGAIFAFIGIGALYTLVVALGTRLFQTLLGPPALLVSLTIFVFLNIPSLGATYTAPLLPPFWRFLNHFWIGAQTVNAERALLYFGRLGVGTAVLIVLAWAGVITAFLLLPVSRKLERRRAHAALAAAPSLSAPRLAGQS